MTWNITVKQFEQYLRLEKSLSGNSVEAYLRDVRKLTDFLELKGLQIAPENITPTILRDFLEWVNELGMTVHSQARTLSGIRAYYKFLIMEDMMTSDPTETIEAPKLDRKLPDTLNFHEIEQLLAAIDLSTPEGTRNRAMLETLYSSGLRVSELLDLKLSNLYEDMGFLKVAGKGDKERLVPIGRDALKHIKLYREGARCHLKIKKGHEVGFTYKGIVFNAGAYTHTSVALSDAVKAIETPVVEVHISNIYAREAFRHKSMLAPYCTGSIVGFGLESYRMALQYFERLKPKQIGFGAK